MECSDMRPVGFSTGAVAYSNFREALKLLGQTTATAVELSALRSSELQPLVEAKSTVPVGRYSQISIHLPSSFDADFESNLLSLAAQFPTDWPLVAHPDAIQEWELWRKLGSRVCIENMDKRKPIGQTRRHLLSIFEKLPDATFCFDIGHAHQVDPTMGEAVLILEEFSGRLRELHISEVNSDSKHDQISLEAERSFAVVRSLIPQHVPAILESRVALPGEALGEVVRQRVETELQLVRRLLGSAVEMAAD
jgi:hypothetical protein